MSQQRMALWAAEADIDEDVDLHLAIGNYGQSGHYEDSHMQEPQIDEATFLAMQQHMAQQAAFSAIPDVVKSFIVHFHQAVLNNNLPEITVAYESGWNKYTEKFYSRTEWPEAEVIAPLVNDDPIFLILYRELYYRHVYSRLQPNIDDRFHSYENSCELFNYLLNSDDPVELELPEQWLWDIIDEFIYQFQVFCTWRSKVKSKTEDELMMLAEGGPVWSSYSVLNVLYSLIQKSRINEYIVAQQEGKTPEEIAKTADRMYALFAICNALSPSRYDDNIANISKERYGEQFAKMARGGEDSLAAFEELFLYACPKFINANPPPYDDPEAVSRLISSSPTDSTTNNASSDPTHRHLALFLADVAAQAPVPTLRSFLKLYTSLGTKKLANFLDVDEEEIVQEMMLMKQVSKHVSRVGANEKSSLLDGQSLTSSDLNFVIADNMVHIAESTVGRRYAGWFIKNTERTARIYDEIKNAPLPKPSKNSNAAAGAISAPTGGDVSTKGPRSGGHKVAWGGVK
ncbi:hypothetical protein H0H81_003718, partial [Sphagnurus paluster]